MAQTPSQSTIHKPTAQPPEAGTDSGSKTPTENNFKTLDAIEPPPPPVVRKIGEFQLEGRLGKGGMGIVYKSYHPRLQKTVAIKVLKDANDLSIDDLNRFRGEALLAATMQHANIVQIFDILQENSTPFIVMEYVDGGSLEQKLAGKPQPPRQAVAWLETIARAVAYAHERQIIHRDLKPGNILITSDGVLKITDFGLGKRLNSGQNETRSGMIIGTPHYMAPEQAAGQSQSIGPAADIHALGAILYEMLTGRPPYQGVNLVEILEQVMNAEPPAPSRLVARIPRPLSTICLKCLSKSPARRYPSALALADDLRRWQDGEDIVARPTGRVERLARTIGRHPLRSALAVSAGLLVVASALVFFLERDRRIKELENVVQRDKTQRADEDARHSASLYAASYGALESVLERINNDAKLRSTPGVRDLQRLMRDRYEQLVALLEADERHRNRMPLAAAYDRLGKLYNRDDKTETALKNYKQSGQIYLAMISTAETPEQALQARLGLGLSLTEQGNLLFDLGKLDDSETAYREALQALTTDLSDHLEIGRSQSNSVSKSIAEVHHRLGTLLDSRSMRQESLAEFKKALAIRDKLVAANGGAKELERDLARSYGYQGDVELELGLTADAETSYWKSHEIRKRLFKPEGTSTDDLEAAFQYARSLSNFGNFHVRARNFATARHFFTQAEAVQKDVVQKDADIIDYALDLAGTQIRLAEMGLLQGSPANALAKDLEAPLKLLSDLLLRDPNNITINASLAENYLLLAMTEFDDEKKKPAALTHLLEARKHLALPLSSRPEADFKYLLASALALQSESMGRVMREDSGWFQSLKEALDLGYSRKDPRDVLNDRAFRHYKDQPEFRKLVKADPSSPAKPKAP